ncbi:MAG: ATP-dependent DNA helicase RecG [Treponema sp.]|jgi:ATP-dependent DNA helicase RecG|nr:ATP-dependent DNA helicase RecG [Treponema sp.]
MLLRSITAPLTAIRGIGPVLVPKFARLGIQNTADLLCHYPRDWEDRTVIAPISEFQRKQVCTEVSVIARDWIGFGRTRTPKIYVEDESGRAALLCFNRPWLDKQLVQGGRFRLWGRFYYKYGEIQSSSFEIESLAAAQSANFGNILPVYPLSAGLNQTMLRRFTSYAIEQYAAQLEDELPPEIIERDKLLPKAAAIRAIHFPATEAERECAKKTLIYEELFYLEVMVGKRASERKGLAVDNTPPLPSPLQQRLLERLPFSLTPGQQEAIAEINADMACSSNHSMARLLQGDVGSGKTLVSFLAALRAADDALHKNGGGQTALMAPTELLARQHAENAARLLEPLGLRIAYLTGNIKAAGRKDLLRHLAAGEIDIAVGTHALFSKDVSYKNLRLVVVDEQHRFGVTQRSLIMAKGNNPHLLMMSATPIPRTLALTVFGDMEVSVIRDMPPGRKPVKTHLAKESSEARVYDFVRKKLETGCQAYFVYPLIENSDEANLKDAAIKDAVSMAERLAKKVFPRFSVALIHSKLDDEEKRQTMECFRSGEISVLVATSVVEVGVDVPNANCMVIEHAERFGLSALHQLRGRVGRGQNQAYCFLVYSDDLTEDGKARLKVMLENTDGFIIAEEDLKLRGPGQIAGTEQSGYLNLGIANPIRDIETLARARTDAFFILKNDPDLVLDGHHIIARVLKEAPLFDEVAL